ncbi:MAG TPA: right-handed parallel beta-helix repeat-containing protein, partial [Rubricoccaceae bacterium]|nr:right-handed parallel beta-helix repeat-containing protein [Rubricoccaceae bacterium]
MQDLGTLSPNPGDRHNAAAVSADGSVVVGASYGNHAEAFRWENGAMTGLGFLPGQPYSAAEAVSADGGVVAGTSGPDAFRWTAATGMQALPRLPGATDCEAYAISADGSTIGGLCTGAAREAVVWTAAGVRSVRAILEDAGVILGGWSLYYGVTGVSEDGSVVVGTGLNPSGGQEAWRAVIGGAPADLVVNTADDDPDEDAADGRCDADEGESGDQCTLRAAIEEAVRRSGGTITFDIEGGGVPRIDVGDEPLPALTAPITIDGTTQPGGAFVELVGPGQGDEAPNISGIEIDEGGGGSVVRGLVVHGFKSFGVFIDADGCTLEGNRIGTDATGTQWRGNGHVAGDRVNAGVVVGSSHNRILNNVIAGNILSLNGGGTTKGGTEILLFRSNNTLQGNRIGVGADGRVVPLPPMEVAGGNFGLYGISSYGDDNVIGGLADPPAIPAACTGPCNVLAGHRVEVDMFSTTIAPSRNTVAGNFIGVDASGAPTTAPPPFASVAVGGSTSSATRVLYNRVVTGASVAISVGSGGEVQGNDIVGRGTGPETGNGAIEVFGDNSRVIGNTIRSHWAGVEVASGSGILISENAISDTRMGGILVGQGSAEITRNRLSDNGIGIDLGGAGVTRNDAGDWDEGPNGLLNFPALVAVAREAGGVRVRGYFAGPVPAEPSYRIEAFSSAGCAAGEHAYLGGIPYGEGAHYLGSAEVTAPLGGVPFEFVVPGVPAGHSVIALTATGTGSRVTSEFSRCLFIGEEAQFAQAEVGPEQTGLVLDGQGVAVTITEPAGGAGLLGGGEGGTLFVTRYEGRPDTSAFAGASATSPSGAEVEPEAIAARHWYLADVGLTPDGGHPASAAPPPPHSIRRAAGARPARAAAAPPTAPPGR